jgi:transposase
MKKEYITEVAWSKILKFLRSSKKVYVGDVKKCKNFIEAVYWISRTGAPWRYLESTFGKWNSMYKRFNAWSKKNVWNDLMNYCIEDPDLEYIMIDATIIRAHPCAAGYKKNSQDIEGLGRSKGGYTSKIHAKVDALGNPLKFIITPGQRNDITQAKSLINGTHGSIVIADKGYDSDDFRDFLFKQECAVEIPPRSNRKNQYEYDEHIYKERHAIECFFGKIKHFRRIFSRFEKSAKSFMSFLSFVGAIIWMR